MRRDNPAHEAIRRIERMISEAKSPNNVNPNDEKISKSFSRAQLEYIGRMFNAEEYTELTKPEGFKCVIGRTWSKNGFINYALVLCRNNKVYSCPNPSFL